jgi:hypothetical protein
VLRVMTVMATGNLKEKIEFDYEGDFDKLK